MASRGDIKLQDIQPDLYKDWAVIPFDKSIGETGSYIKIKSSEYNDNGLYPVIDQGEKYISGYINDSNSLYKGNLPIIIFGDHTRNIKYVDSEFAVGADGTKILHPIKQLYSKFYYYYLKALTIPNLGYSRHYSILRRVDVPLPSLAEQKRIADKLDTLFGQLSTIQKALERIPELIKNFRQQVLTSAVTGKLTEKWRKGKTLDKWENKSIGSLFKVQTGSTPRRENNAYYDFGKIPWIKSGEVKNTLIFNSNEYITELAIQETNAKIYPINTILIAMYGEGKTRGQVGLLKIPAASNQAVAALVNDKGYNIITIKYVFFFCLSQYNNIRNQAKGGNQPNLNLTTIKKWEIPLPPQKEQEEVVRIIDSIFKKLETIEQQYNILKTKIEKLPQVLLNKAFSGELVDHLPSDGNAENLLKEIEQLKRSTKKE